MTLVPVAPSVLSAYVPGRVATPSDPRSALTPLCRLRLGRFTPDTADALLVLHQRVEAAGGDWRVSDGMRDLEDQRTAVATKAPGLARPVGDSFHQSGRAIDFDRDAMRFPGVPADRQLDKLWELAIPLGWAPVIRAADERAKESWHLDFPGPWATLRVRGYGEAARASLVCVRPDEALKLWSAPKALTMEVQARLWLYGYDPGPIDGIAGPSTLAAISRAGAPSEGTLDWLRQRAPGG